MTEVRLLVVYFLESLFSLNFIKNFEVTTLRKSKIYYVKNHSDYKYSDIKKMLEFLIDNIYVGKMPLQIIFDHETKRQENLQILR